MSNGNVILITGAARGVGYALVESYAKNPRNIIFAGVRDPTKAAALQILVTGSEGRIHMVKITSGDEKDNNKAADEVEKLAGHVDIVLAVAASPVISKSTLSDLSSFIMLSIPFSTSLHLLKSPLAHPKLVVISALGGSSTISSQVELKLGGYGVSKAAVNFAVVRIAKEQAARGLIAVPIHPGIVTTEMGDAVIKTLGLPEGEAPKGLTFISAAESAYAIQNVIDGLKFEDSGKFYSYDRSQLPW